MEATYESNINIGIRIDISDVSNNKSSFIASNKQQNEVPVNYSLFSYEAQKILNPLPKNLVYIFTNYIPNFGKYKYVDEE